MTAQARARSVGSRNDEKGMVVSPEMTTPGKNLDDSTRTARGYEKRPDPAGARPAKLREEAPAVAAPYKGEAIAGPAGNLLVTPGRRRFTPPSLNAEAIVEIALPVLGALGQDLADGPISSARRVIVLPCSLAAKAIRVSAVAVSLIGVMSVMLGAVSTTSFGQTGGSLRPERKPPQGQGREDCVYAEATAATNKRAKQAAKKAATKRIMGIPG